jgi:hypothetical protein
MNHKHVLSVESVHNLVNHYDRLIQHLKSTVEVHRDVSAASRDFVHGKNNQVLLDSMV